MDINSNMMQHWKKAPLVKKIEILKSISAEQAIKFWEYAKNIGINNQEKELIIRRFMDFYNMVPIELIHSIWEELYEDCQYNIVYEILQGNETDICFIKFLLNLPDKCFGKFTPTRSMLQAGKGGYKSFAVKRALKDLDENIIEELQESENIVSNYYRKMPPRIIRKYISEVLKELEGDNDKIREFLKDIIYDGDVSGYGLETFSNIFAFLLNTESKEVFYDAGVMLLLSNDVLGKCAEHIKKYFCKILDEGTEKELECLRNLMRGVLSYGEHTPTVIYFDGIINEALKSKNLKCKIRTDINKNKIVIGSCADLSIENLNILEKIFGKTTICIRFSAYEGMREERYDSETYKKCRAKIDELLNGIDLFTAKDNPNREKWIFGQVIRRIARHISYDYETVKKEKKGIKTEGSLKSRNLEGGLLHGTSVCAGYAEIVRNVFDCCGIDVRYVSGRDKNPEGSPHAWNQIKLDGKWYNMDITWDRDRIVNGMRTKYLLKSDRDFYKHNYDTGSLILMKCNDTCYNVDKYIYEEQPLKTQSLMCNFWNDISMTDFRNAKRIIMRSLRNIQSMQDVSRNIKR